MRGTRRESETEESQKLLQTKGKLNVRSNVRSNVRCNVRSVYFCLHVFNEAQWSHGWRTRAQNERSVFEPWLGILCCVRGQDTLLSQCLSPHRFINGYRRIQKWGSPAMDYIVATHPGGSRNTPSHFMVQTLG